MLPETFPSSIAGYLLEAAPTGTPLLGQGGFGRVYRARDRQSQDLVALKVLFNATDADIQRFEQEANTLLVLNHRGIVGVRAFPSEQGQPVLVMEYVEGMTLDKWLGQSPPPATGDRLRILYEVADALAHAHSQRIQHRDIKPGNIMIGRDQRARVLDFGIARRLSALDENSRSDTGMATLHYMSPELVRSGRTSLKSDVFSFGTLLYRVLAGKLPFSGATDFLVQDAILHHQPVPLRELDPNIPAACEQLVNECLVKDPAGRETTMADIASRLNLVRHEKEIQQASRLLEEALRLARAGQKFEAVNRARQADQLWPDTKAFLEIQKILDEVFVLSTDPWAPVLDTLKALLGKGDPGSLSAAEALLSQLRPQLASHPGFQELERLWKIAQPTIHHLVSKTLPFQAGERRLNTKDGLHYAWIPAGSYEIGCLDGSKECERDEKIKKGETKGYWMGESEVTQGAFERMMGKNPSYFKGADLPVDQVTWEEAKNYCEAVGGRLPTEEEWEYAARAGSREQRYGELGLIAWYEANSGKRTQAVKGKAPNGWGLFDMLGNVSEWTSSKYEGTSIYVLRGGSWYSFPTGVRASRRGHGSPGERHAYVGFRCVLDSL
jgi:serine/threonine protein kinase